MNNTERELVLTSSQTARKSQALKAIEDKNLKIAKELFRRDLINSLDKEGKTLLHHSIQEGRSDITIDLNANPNSEDYKGHTPLQYAINENRSEQIDFLRENNSVTRSGNFQGGVKNYRLVTCYSSESRRYSSESYRYSSESRRYSSESYRYSSESRRYSPESYRYSSESEVPCEYSEHSRFSTASSSCLQEQPSDTSSIEAFATEDNLLPKKYNLSIPSLPLNSINRLGGYTNNSSRNQPRQLYKSLITFREFRTTTLTVDGNNSASLCLPDKGEVDDLPSADCTLMHDNHDMVPISETLPENSENAIPLDSDPANDSEQLTGHKNLNTVVTSGMASFNAENVGLENPCPTAVRRRSGCIPNFFNCFKKKSR